MLVGSATSDVFHVFELKSMIAAFAMFVPQAQPCMTQISGFVTFQIAEAPRRVQSWLQDQMSCAMPLSADGCGSADFLCLQDGRPVSISVGVFSHPWYSGTDSSLAHSPARLDLQDTQLVLKHLFHDIPTHACSACSDASLTLKYL